MRDEPVALTLELVADCLHRCWGIGPAELTYAPLGHGSYHWIGADRSGPRWFVTADHLTGTVDQSFATLSAAANTSRQLADGGLDFVLAPLPDRAGVLVQRVLPDWALQVFPYLPGRSTDQGSWSDPAEQAEVARLVGRLHAAIPPRGVPRWEFAIPGRAELETALEDLDRPWPGGPYAETVREFLAETRTSIRALLRRYDDVVREVAADTDPWVVTHGEPDSDNVIRTDDGGFYLIDWGSARLAPRERDLVEILNGVADVLPSYQETAGTHPARPAAIELFTIGWSLFEAGRKVRLFHRPDPGHTPTVADWERLREQVVNPGGWYQPPAQAPPASPRGRPDSGRG